MLAMQRQLYFADSAEPLEDGRVNAARPFPFPFLSFCPTDNTNLHFSNKGHLGSGTGPSHAPSHRIFRTCPDTGGLYWTIRSRETRVGIECSDIAGWRWMLRRRTLSPSKLWPARPQQSIRGKRSTQPWERKTPGTD